MRVNGQGDWYYTYLNGDGSPKAAGAAVLDGTATRGRSAAAS